MGYQDQGVFEINIQLLIIINYPKNSTTSRIIFMWEAYLYKQPQKINIDSKIFIILQHWNLVLVQNPLKITKVKALQWRTMYPMRLCYECCRGVKNTSLKLFKFIPEWCIFAIISRTCTEAKEYELPSPNALVMYIVHLKHEFSLWIISK